MISSTVFPVISDGSFGAEAGDVLVTGVVPLVEAATRVDDVCAAELVLELTAFVELAVVTPKEGSATLDCVCDDNEDAVVGDFKDSEKELALPEDDAGVLVMPKLVTPEVGADALVPDGADTVNAGNVKPVLALIPVEDALTEAGVVALVVVVVVTVENRAD